MLIDLLPLFYSNSYEVTEIQGALNSEVEALKQAQQDFLNQLFIDTATWGLDYWERYLGITVDITKPTDFRRTRIISKLRGQGTTTIAMIKNVAESFSNGTVTITEHNDQYSFTVKFISNKGIPPNLDDLKAAIEEIKPAHLLATYEFTYNTHDFLKNKTHDFLKTMTYDQIKIFS